MTLIVGLKTNDCVVVGAEREEVGGITAKREVTKLQMITGTNWAVVVGAAGDAYLGEKAMQRMRRDLAIHKRLNGAKLTDATEKILDSIYTKYVDKDPKNEGISLVIGAVCGNRFHLISTIKRVAQEQSTMAYAGYGSDIGVFFMDRLHREDADWVYTARVAGFTLQQAVEACQYCGGESEIYVLQARPHPRWRALGRGDAPIEFKNDFQKWEVSNVLASFIEREKFSLEGCDGYSDEFIPNPIDRLRGPMPFVSLDFFPSFWLRSSAYQKHVEEICNRNRDRLLQSGYLSNRSALAQSQPQSPETCETASPQQGAKEQ